MSPPPILVVGCGHSGTSIMLAMLGEHSLVHAIPGETNFLRHKGRRARISSFYLQAWAAGKRTWAEKTPKHIHHIADMLAIWPSTKFVCMVRDGRDVALSIKKRTGDFEAGCRRWISDNEAWLSLAPHPALHMVQYERLVKDPDGEVRKLCAFLGLPFEPGMLHPENTQKNWYARSRGSRRKEHENRRNLQINQPLFDDSGRWRGQISPDELRLFNQLTGDLPLQLGYEPA